MALALSPALCHTDGNGVTIKCRMGTPEVKMKKLRSFLFNFKLTYSTGYDFL